MLTKKDIYPEYTINNNKLKVVFNADRADRTENLVDIYLYNTYLGFDDEKTEAEPKYDGINANIVADFEKVLLKQILMKK